MISDLRAQGYSALVAADLPAAKRALETIRGLHGELNSTYTLQIVERPETGFYLDVDPAVVSRTPVEQLPPSLRTKQRSWWIVVEPVDVQGNTVRTNVRDVFLGTTESVTKYAIQIPESFQLQVREDKADGHIDNRVAGVKTRGQLTPKYSAPMTATIVEWDRYR